MVAIFSLNLFSILSLSYTVNIHNKILSYACMHTGVDLGFSEKRVRVLYKRNIWRTLYLANEGKTGLPKDKIGDQPFSAFIANGKL